MNWRAVTGYVGLTAIGISALSHLAAEIIPEHQFHDKLGDILRWAHYIWTYAVVIMGYYLAKTHRNVLLLWGGIFTAAGCLLLPHEIGILLAMVYFFWAYAKLDIARKRFF